MNAIIEMKPAESRAITLSSPGQLAQLAIERGDLDLDRLERLMVMQERWEANEAKKAYNVSFSDFKSEAVVIVKNRHVTDGPLRGKSYAELHSVVGSITPALSRHGLSAAWKLTKDEKDWIEVTCTLRHIGGHSECVSMGGPPDAGGAKNAIMARASTVSYLERYTLKAITGVAEGGEDDDGAGGAEPVPIALLMDARSAAMGGWKSLSEWIKGRSEADIKQLEPESYGLKKAAKEADKAKP